MINRLSFLFDKPKRSYNEIGTLNLMILNNSTKQRYLYRFSIASSSYFVNRGLVASFFFFCLDLNLEPQVHGSFLIV